MKLAYIANVRMPTEKAHGLTIMKSCEAFARNDAEIMLVVPRRKNRISEDPFSYYSSDRTFTIKFLPTLELYRFRWIPLQVSFGVQSATFYISVVAFLLFKKRDVVVYSRDILAVLTRFLGFFVAYECHHIPTKTKYFFAIAKRAQGIVTISSSLKRIFVEHGFVGEDIIIAPSGVDLSVFDFDMGKGEARKQLGLPPNAFLTIYTGTFKTMGEEKGLEHVIRAHKLLPDSNVFVAVGGDENDREQYKRLADELGISYKVILRGRTTQHTLARYQKAADALIMPFPNLPHYRNYMSPVKMFEYMSSKRPILSTDLPTIREVLDDSSALFVEADSDSFKTISFAIHRLAADRKLGESISNHAYGQVKVYEWNQRTKRILAHLQSRING